ncbi:MAG TPA: ABC transporter ATP-binding protein, partial [Clostridiales bacterium]|nr:ABC transporter ATP-binding protein [Clostridiales bacterium]
LLLDEPLSNLDARLRLEMREEIRRIQQQTQVTTVFVTHDQEEAMSISDHIALMKDGYLQQYDKPQQLYDSPNNQFVADFLGAPPINHLNGTLVNGQFTLTDGSAAFPLPLPVDGVPQGRPLILAIRAESAAVAESAEQAAFPATVKQVYTMGKEELAYLTVGTQEMRAYIDLDAGIVPGAPLHVALKPRGVFLFDAETGVRYQ